MVIGLINTFSPKSPRLLIGMISLELKRVHDNFTEGVIMRKVGFLFLLMPFLALAGSLASSDAFGIKLRDHRVNAMGRAQAVPKEIPVKQPEAQHQSPSNTTAKPPSDDKKQVAPSDKKQSVLPTDDEKQVSPSNNDGQALPSDKEQRVSQSDNDGQVAPSEPQGTTPPDQSGKKDLQVPSNQDAMPEPILVNKEKENALSSTYVPPDLTVPAIPFSFTEYSPKKLMVLEAARAVERLFDAAEKAGIALVGVSAYRSYERQESIFQQHVASIGREEAERVSAPPGHSEHQTGLAIDVSSPSVNNQLVEEFGDTWEGRWLAENAPLHGFIVRYPRYEEDVTGFRYEPWHIRYVGEQVAQVVAANGLTLEEHLGGNMIAQN